MNAAEPNGLERTWWKANKSSVGASVQSLAFFLLRHQKERRRANALHMQIVANDDPSGRGPDVAPMAAAINRLQGTGAERSRYLLCLSIVETACSIISSAKPTLQILTQAGDWDLQRRAKKQTLALAGQMRSLGMETLGPKCFKDATINDIGGVYGCIHPETKKVHLERVQANEILVDHNEALTGDPRNLYRVRPVNKERLKELYPKKAEAIEKAECVSADYRSDFYLSRESASESVLLVEAWHLGTKDRPGRYVMCVGQATLVDEPYEHCEFPFAFVRYADMPLGWYGQSLVSRTKEAQKRINQLIRRYERSQDLNSKCVTVVPRSSGLTPDQITNLPGQVVMSESGDPKLLTWNGTPPDLRAEIPAIREETLNNEGLSEQQVQGEKVPGVTSAVGLRASDDIQARRHVHPQRRYETFHIDVAKLIARLNDDATEEDPNYTVTGQVKRGRRDYIHTTKWKDVQTDWDDVRLQIFPTSSLSTTPKGRRDDVMGLLQAGMITQQTALELLDMPDLDTDTANQLAEIDYSRWLIEQVMDGEDYLIDPILGVDGLTLAMDTARKAYLQCAYSEAPDEVLDRLREFMEDVLAEIERLQPPPEPAAAPMGAPMGMDPMAAAMGGAPVDPTMADPAMAAAAGLPPAVMGQPVMGVA